MINTLSYNNNNVFLPVKPETAFASLKKEGYITAPDSLPKYSLTNEINKKDEFRKNVNAEFIKKSEKKDSAKSKLIFIAAAVAGFFLLKGKK